MKAITIWQPWATLIMIGAKPWEFRKFDFRKLGIKVDQVVAIHAGARPVRMDEVADMWRRLDDPICSTGLIEEKARPLLLRLMDAMTNCTPGRPSLASSVVEMSALLGMVRMGEPKLSEEAMPLWKGQIGDSDRLEHCKWAWPMLDVHPFEEPIRTRGAQGFWNAPIPEFAT